MQSQMVLVDGRVTKFSRCVYLAIAFIFIGPFEFKVEGRSKTAGTAEGCDFWDQNGVLLLHLRAQQQRKSKINKFTMSDGIE